MNCHIISIGNELLNGEVIDTNANYLEKELYPYSIFAKKITVLPDDAGDISKELSSSFGRFDYIFITGGLGPTLDDVTRDGVAEALGSELIRSEDTLRDLESKLALREDNVFREGIQRQCFFPKDAQILGNPLGTAAAFYIKYKKSNIYVLPGVPSEMKAIFEGEIRIRFNKEFSYNDFPRKLTVKTFGIGESKLDFLMKEKIYSYDLPFDWEIVATSKGVFLKLYPKEDLYRKKDWRELLRTKLIRHIGRYIYAYDDDDMQTAVARLLISNKLTLSTVESCTGGYIGKYLTDFSGSSAYYLGSIISYSNEVKINIANVDDDLIKEYGVVSNEVARAMACGGKKALKSDICLSVTGIAGPDGGNKLKPVGTVCFALVGKNDEVIIRKEIFRGNRDDIRTRTVFYALNLVRISLDKD